jgi:hypothetical protein
MAFFRSKPRQRSAAARLAALDALDAPAALRRSSHSSAFGRSTKGFAAARFARIPSSGH